MADPLHLSKLCEGAKAWNEWRKGYPDLTPDLTRLNLPLGRRQFGLVNGGPIDFSAVRLTQADLRQSVLTETNLSQAKLSGADLTNARLERADLRGTDFTNAMFAEVDVTDAIFDGALVAGAQLERVRNLSQAQLDASAGDASTTLPPHLHMPLSWWPEVEAGTQPGIPPILGPKESAADLYTALGVTRRATSEEIRQAYFHRAKELHPDLNPGDLSALESFKFLSRGAALLRDSQTRALYDRGVIDASGRKVVSGAPLRRRMTSYRDLRSYACASAAAIVLFFGIFVSGLVPVELSQAREQISDTDSSLIASAPPPEPAISSHPSVNPDPKTELRHLPAISASYRQWLASKRRGEFGEQKRKRLHEGQKVQLIHLKPAKVFRHGRNSVGRSVKSKSAGNAGNKFRFRMSKARRHVAAAKPRHAERNSKIRWAAVSSRSLNRFFQPSRRQ